MLLSVRETNKYVGTYAHLDTWCDIGTYTELARGVHTELARGVHTDEEAIEEYTTATLLLSVTLDQPEPAERIARALESAFSKNGCHHEWDCCGCWSSSAEATHLNGDKWMVVQRSSRNY